MGLKITCPSGAAMAGKPPVLEIVSADISVTVRWPSGDVYITRQSCPESHLASDLRIPLGKGVFKLLKGLAVVDHEMRIWNEGENTSVELTCVMTRQSLFVMELYIGVCIENDYTASN